jgi:putative addiction module killer protein
MTRNEVRHYVSPEGVDVFARWFDGLRDRRAQSVIAVRVDRLQRGLLGDTRSVGEGVQELKIDFGPGYRVYCACAGGAVILLLGGGDKATQRADIADAKRRWLHFRSRRRE